MVLMVELELELDLVYLDVEEVLCVLEHNFLLSKIKKLSANSRIAFKQAEAVRIYKL